MKPARYVASIIIAAILLLALTFTSGCGKKEFKILDRRVVTELNERGQPADKNQDLSGQSIAANEKAVYLWFKYPRLAQARKVKWEIIRTDQEGSKDTYGDEFELKQGSSSAYFGIELDSGGTLPPGDYELMLKEPAGTGLLKDPADPKKDAPVRFTVK